TGLGQRARRTGRTSVDHGAAGRALDPIGRGRGRGPTEGRRAHRPDTQRCFGSRRSGRTGRQCRAIRLHCPRRPRTGRPLPAPRRRTGSDEARAGPARRRGTGGALRQARDAGRIPGCDRARHRRQRRGPCRRPPAPHRPAGPAPGQWPHLCRGEWRAALPVRTAWTAEGDCGERAAEPAGTCRVAGAAGRRVGKRLLDGGAGRGTGEGEGGTARGANRGGARGRGHQLRLPRYLHGKGGAGAVRGWENCWPTIGQVCLDRRGAPGHFQPALQARGLREWPPRVRRPSATACLRAGWAASRHDLVRPERTLGTRLFGTGGNDDGPDRRWRVGVRRGRRAWGVVSRGARAMTTTGWPRTKGAGGTLQYVVLDRLLRPISGLSYRVAIGPQGEMVSGTTDAHGLSAVLRAPAETLARFHVARTSG